MSLSVGFFIVYYVIMLMTCLFFCQHVLSSVTMFVPLLFSFLGMVNPQSACLLLCWLGCSKVGMDVPKSAWLFLSRHVCSYVNMFVIKSAWLLISRHGCSYVGMFVPHSPWLSPSWRLCNWISLSPAFYFVICAIRI